MVFRINPHGVSSDPRYKNYPSYFIEILEENDGSYEFKGSWYIPEENFVDIVTAILIHERDVDRIRKREPQYPKLEAKIRELRLHEIMERGFE